MIFIHSLLLQHQNFLARTLFASKQNQSTNPDVPMKVIFVDSNLNGAPYLE